MACPSFMPKLFRLDVSMGGHQPGQSQEFSLYTYPRKWNMKIIPRSRPKSPRRGLFLTLFGEGSPGLDGTNELYESRKMKLLKKGSLLVTT